MTTQRFELAEDQATDAELTAVIRVFDRTQWVEGLRWFWQPNRAYIGQIRCTGRESCPDAPHPDAIAMVEAQYPDAYLVYLRP